MTPGPRVLLVSTYDLGRQPFGLASPAAWLREAGAEVRCLDLAVCRLDEAAVRQADLVAFHLPMHTAARIALRAIDEVRAVNPRAHLCAYGIYAPPNRALLRRSGVRTILGGEFERELAELARRLAAGVPEPAMSRVTLERLAFRVPQRDDLPELRSYAHLRMPDGSRRTVGYTEATRGCKHVCRHCPIVPVYEGRFRVVEREVVLEDVRRQVTSGAEHITFGDPDFFNGPRHAVELVRALHREHPGLTYDVTIKVEHLLRGARYLPLLRDTGCAFVTSAVESLDDRVLGYLDKRHTRADFFRAVELLDEVGLPLQPTFVAFHPWISRTGYRELLLTLAELDLIDNVSPVQLAIRLLIPAGSKLLGLPELQAMLGPFDQDALCYRWEHPDPRVDALQRCVERLVATGTEGEPNRRRIFEAVLELVRSELEDSGETPPDVPPRRARQSVPYLTEPWYC